MKIMVIIRRIEGYLVRYKGTENKQKKRNPSHPSPLRH